LNRRITLTSSKVMSSESGRELGLSEWKRKVDDVFCRGVDEQLFVVPPLEPLEGPLFSLSLGDPSALRAPPLSLSIGLSMSRGFPLNLDLAAEV
jgi:hypothetical protein